jgi:hypothetical protein
VTRCRCRFNPVMMAPISSTRSAGAGPGGGAPVRAAEIAAAWAAAARSGRTVVTYIQPEQCQRDSGGESRHDGGAAADGGVGELRGAEVLMGDQHPPQRCERVAVGAESLCDDRGVGVVDGSHRSDRSGLCGGRRRGRSPQLAVPQLAERLIAVVAQDDAQARVDHPHLNIATPQEVAERPWIVFADQDLAVDQRYGAQDQRRAARGVELADSRHGPDAGIAVACRACGRHLPAGRIEDIHRAEHRPVRQHPGDDGLEIRPATRSRAGHPLQRGQTAQHGRPQPITRASGVPPRLHRQYLGVHHTVAGEQHVRQPECAQGDDSDQSEHGDHR